MALAVPVAAGLAAVVLTVAPVPAASSGSPGPLGGCFGNHGVQFAGKDAYLCEVKLGGDPSGSLYFSPSLDNGLNGAPCTTPPNCPQMVWYKLHPAPGNFYVWENFSEPWGGSSPRSNGRIIGIDEGRFGQCIVNWPSWSTTPTTCTTFAQGGSEGGTHQLTPAELASVREFITNMRAAIPLEYR